MLIATIAVAALLGLSKDLLAQSRIDLFEGIVPWADDDEWNDDDYASDPSSVAQAVEAGERLLFGSNQSTDTPIGRRTLRDIGSAQQEHDQWLEAERKQQASADRLRAQKELSRQLERRSIKTGPTGPMHRRTQDGKTVVDVTQMQREIIEFYNPYPIPEWMEAMTDSDHLRTIPEWVDEFKHAEPDTYDRRMVAESLSVMLRQHMNDDLTTPLTPKELMALMQGFQQILLTRNTHDDYCRQKVLEILQEAHAPDMEQALVQFLEWATTTSSKVPGQSLDDTRRQRQHLIGFAATALARLWWPVEFYQDALSRSDSAGLSPAGEIHVSWSPHLTAENPLFGSIVENARQIEAGTRSKPSAPPEFPTAPRTYEPPFPFGNLR
jgi:hypothetical protein